jgi:hypothetical protein
MSSLTLLLLLAGLLLLVLLAVVLLKQGHFALDLGPRSGAGAYTPRDLQGLYQAHPGRAPQLSGGLLVHSMLLEDVERWLRAEPFAIHGNDAAICDCSFPSEELGGSCSAWTLLRSDLMPTIFSSPDARSSSPEGRRSRETSIAQRLASTPSIGIIVNPALAWQLISSMAVIDAATDERNCGQLSYADAATKTIDVACTAADRGVGRDGEVVVRGPLQGSDLCRKDCEVADDYCRLQNAGGTIALSNLGRSARGNWGCSDCSGPFPASGIEGKMQGCSQSSVPFVCRLQSPESVPAEDLVDPSAWAPYGKSQGYAFAAVGPQAEGLQSLFLTPDGKLSDAWTIGGSQCKFLREDWAAWVRSVQRFYETVYRAYDAARRELPAEHSASIGRNYLMSCPGYGYNFFENEVNLYFNRRSSEERFRRLAEKQSEVLRRSIVGFYVVGTRCEEQLASLQGVPCSVGDASFSGARDRCLGYFSGEDRGEEVYRAFRALEERHLRRGEELVRRLTDAFNRTYCGDGLHRKVQAYRYVGSNSTFFDLRQLARLVEEKRQIGFEEVFVPLA